MGLFTAAIGLQMFFQTQESLIVLGALIIGAILGEWWRIEDGIANLGAWLEKTIYRLQRRWHIQPIRTRLPGGFPALLHRSNRHHGFHSRRAERRLPTTGR